MNEECFWYAEQKRECPKCGVTHRLPKGEEE